MDFYKKISANKSKESLGTLLAQKECKCASLQAITNAAIKDNNKKKLKELVEEINGHLADLHAIADNSNQKYSDTRERLTKQFEECLIKIVNNSSLNILNPLNAQLQELNNLTNAAIRDNNYGQLQKLAERMERNITILKEIPEVKTARHSQNGDDKTLEVFNKYNSLLSKVLEYVNARKPRIAAEAKPEEKPAEAQQPLSENVVVLHEVEEKLKLMRQVRLNRQSLFVNEQTKLTEKRSTGNSPKKSGETLEISSQPAIAPIQSRENLKLSQYKAAAKVTERNQARSEEKEKLKPVENPELPLSKREIPSSHRDSGGQHQNILIKSFAERQIENARNQQSSKGTVKNSNSSKTTPPRTPTQMRKIFNSFNCVQKSGANHKSIEDLSGEFQSPFEQELKSFHLKTTGHKEKMEGERVAAKDWRSMSIPRSNSFKSSVKPEDGPVYENVPVLPPRKFLSDTQKQEKSAVSIQKPGTLKKDITQHYEENEDGRLFVNSVCIGQTAPAVPNPSSRASLHLDTLMIRPEEIADVAIIIRNDKKGIAVPPSSPDRNSFSTFRNNNESNKEVFAVENPLYDIPILKTEPVLKETRKSLPEIAVEAIKPEVITSQANSSDFSTLDFIIGRRNLRTSYRRQVSSDTDHKFRMLQPDIIKLEYAIQMYKGLKRDEDYVTLDKTLSKYYVNVNDVPANSAFDKMEKESLMERLNKAHKDLKERVERNEDVMRRILEEQAVMIRQRHGIV